MCSGEVEVDHLTWEHMCYFHMNDNYIHYMYYVHVSLHANYLVASSA